MLRVRAPFARRFPPALMSPGVPMRSPPRLAPRGVPSHLATLLLLAAAPLGAQATQLQIASNSKITIFGTSNVHNWDCSTSDFDVKIEVPASARADLGKEVSAIDVTIPVDKIECGHKGMADNMRKAMDAKKYPTIRFRSTSYTAMPAKSGDAYEATIKGTLTIHGVDKPATLKATVWPDGKGSARAEGSTEIVTTDFGVQPVKALMGTIRTGDRATIVLTLHAHVK
jgi:polyisoprenoid-binding protein YceI